MHLHDHQSEQRERKYVCMRMKRQDIKPIQTESEASTRMGMSILVRCTEKCEIQVAERVKCVAPPLPSQPKLMVGKAGS